MGTNYYAIRVMSREDKGRAKKMIEEDRYDELNQLIPEDIHIGKRSGGWQFLFDHQNWRYFEPNEKSIKDWILKQRIKDEYGKDIPPDEFLEMALDWKGYNMAKYVKDHPDEKIFLPNSDNETIRMLKNKGIVPDKYGEFEIGKMRFTYFIDFG